MATRRKPTTRKRKPARRTATKDHTLNWVGVVFVVVGLLAMFRLGLIGAVFANCFRLLGGNTFIFLTVLFTTFGAWLTATASLPHIKPRWLWGGLLAYVSILVLVTGLSMTQLNIHSHFELAIWRTLQNDFALVTTTSDAGGGLLGGLIFGLFAPLISMIGTEILFGVLTLVGILIIAGVTPEQVFNVFHAIGRGCGRMVSGLKTGIMNMQDHVESKPKRQAKPKVQKADPAPEDKDLPKPRAQADDFTINAPQPTPQPTPQPAPQPQPKPEPKPAAQPDDEGELDTGNAGADYIMPPISLLTPVPAVDQSKEVNLIKQNRVKLKDTMDSFGVDVSVKSATLGPPLASKCLRSST